MLRVCVLCLVSLKIDLFKVFIVALNLKSAFIVFVVYYFYSATFLVDIWLH